jgi:hypothetical protein
MTSHAFIDESARRDTYLMCMTAETARDLPASRQALRRLLLPGQSRLHFATESDRRRRLILSRLGDLTTASVVFVAAHRNQPAARAAILTRAFVDKHCRDVTRVTIESRQGQDHTDRATIFRALGPKSRIVYRHATAAEEPMLWVPDAIAWAYGRGGNWRRQVERLELVADVTRVEIG